MARLAAAQAARGHQVTIVSALKPKERGLYQLATRNIPHYDRVRTLLCPWTTHVGRWFGQRLKPIYKSIMPFVDVLHIHGMWEPMLVVAANEARRHRVPYVVRPCGTLDPWSLRQSRLKKKIALAVSHKKMLDRAGLIHTLNSDEARLIEPLHIAAPGAIIPNGVFLDEVDDTPPDDSLLASFPALLTHPYVLFLARLHHKKGLDILAAAFTKLAARNKDVHLLVAGPDGGAQESFLAGDSGTRTKRTGTHGGAAGGAGEAHGVSECDVLLSAQPAGGVQPLGHGRPWPRACRWRFPRIVIFRKWRKSARGRYFRWTRTRRRRPWRKFSLRPSANAMRWVMRGGLTWKSI